MKIRFLVLSSLILFAFSCNSNNMALTGKSRVQPKPSTIDQNALKQAESVVKVGDLNIPKIFLNKTFEDLNPVVPQEANLAEFEFTLEIKFDGVLGRISIDDGELLSSPVKLKVKGGVHTIKVIDLLTSCYIHKKYVIDKNTVFNFTKERDC